MFCTQVGSTRSNKSVLIVSIDYTTLSFIGVPFTVVPFPLSEMQAQWCVNADYGACLLTCCRFCYIMNGEVKLPSSDSMKKEIADERREQFEAGAKSIHQFDIIRMRNFFDLVQMDTHRKAFPENKEWNTFLRTFHGREQYRVINSN